ncbi:type II toxin-antitoxin system PemK/MazF family toxin [Ruania zhangjianzhongii]|uniref:type II toxin-antitoxin system PemK/MazF family toxin n=1 Tax=Ruania zhangjianzhongii TaxID=2603206 RepID=UPI0011CB2405|nr:type II toxin-antitoxin system PemK/MazF family toxin [Ruania zhangjianzhongii]
MSLLSSFARAARLVAREAVRSSRREARRASTRRQRSRPQGPSAGQRAHTYLGPLPPPEYAPVSDGAPDPGEVVWAWVPYEEDDSRGKDRPVLILAEHDDGLLGLQLTSKDHDTDAEQEARWGRYWVDVGSGAWDSQRRESEARVDRVLWLPLSAVRREGAALDRDRFTDAVAAVRRHRG